MIPFESLMHGIDLGEEGIELGKWTTSVIDDMGEHLKDSMKGHYELFETLARDPEEFVEIIEQEPWRIVTTLHPVANAMELIFSYGEEKIRSFAGYDEIKLPKGWLSDL